MRKSTSRFWLVVFLIVFVAGAISYFVGLYYESVTHAPDFVLVATIGALVSIAAAIAGIMLATVN